jgi:hypothetical protein
MGLTQLALVAVLTVGCANAIFFGTGAAAGTAIVGSTATTAATGGLVFASGGLLALNVIAGGVVILKAAAVLAALSASRGGGSSRGGRSRGGHRRGRRSVNEQKDLNLELSLLAALEPEQCYRRIICELATGQMPKSANDVIPSLFGDVLDNDIASPVFEFSVAAKLGEQVKDIRFCELRYRCPVSGSQILEATQ